MKNLLKYSLPGLLLLGFLLSCGSGGSKPEDAVARVNDKYLTRSDLQGIVPKGTPKKDSAAIIQNYIRNWIQQQLVLEQARANLSSEQMNFDRQLEEYRNSLIMYAYEKELIRQKLDTIVTQAQIADYYQKHQQDFQLRENILKVLYVKVPLNSASLPRMRNLIRSERPDDRKPLEELCKQYAQNYYLDDQSWLYFNDLLKEIPLKPYEQSRALTPGQLVEISDSASSYVLYVKDFKAKENISPLNFESANIRNIILNQRKIRLVAEMEKDLYKKAAEQKSFEIFN